MAAPHPSLPRLAFGNATAQASDDLAAFTAAQRVAMSGICRYEPLRSKHPFLHRSTTVRIRDVRLVASASTPLSVAADESGETTVLVPFHGWGTSTLDGREHRWQAGGTAMFLPGAARTGTSGVRSMLAISLDPRRLEATARRMLGAGDGDRVDLGLDTPRLLGISAARSPVLGLLRHVLPLIDRAGCREDNLRMLGIDDLIHRIVALMLAPTTLARSFVQSGSAPSMTVLQRATDYIVAHLDKPITLGDLERVSGLSARALQIAFRKAHNCSPREWIQRRRLTMARDRLESAAADDTVSGIALACGFTRLATFSTAYARRFGEAPSTALARGRRR